MNPDVGGLEATSCNCYRIDKEMYDRILHCQEPVGLDLGVQQATKLPFWICYLPRSLCTICHVTQPRRSHFPARPGRSAASKKLPPTIQAGWLLI